MQLTAIARKTARLLATGAVLKLAVKALKQKRTSNKLSLSAQTANAFRSTTKYR
jgi:hypothetical protein